MTNADKIRNMTDEELNSFLWWSKCGAVGKFITQGGAGLMNAQEQLLWLTNDEPWEGTEFDQPAPPQEG